MPPGAGKGCYVLILRVPAAEAARIGRLGRLTFSKGYYAYTGSAMGSGGLAARVGHHLKQSSRPHWHMDYLRRIATVQQVWYRTGEVNLEHHWAKILKGMAGSCSIDGFGCSDCGCRSHLFRFGHRPGFAAFQAACREGIDHSEPIMKWNPF